MKESYAINMLWIQSDGSQEDLHDYIYYQKKRNARLADLDERAILEKMLFDPAKNWAQANPDGKIFIWFDSDKTGRDSVVRTQAALDDYKKKHCLSNVSLRDIQEIGIVRGNPDQFSNCIGLYARIDFLKMILCYHCMHEEGYQHAVFSDITPLDDDQYPGYAALFSDHIRQTLDEYGIVVGANAACEVLEGIVEGLPENQFLQFKKDPVIERVLSDLINVSIINLTRALYHPSSSVQIEDIRKHFFRLFFEMEVGRGDVSITELYYGYKNESITVSADHDAFRDNCYLKDQTGAVLLDTKNTGFSPLGDYAVFAIERGFRVVFPEYYEAAVDYQVLVQENKRLLPCLCRSLLNYPKGRVGCSRARADIIYNRPGTSHIDAPKEHGGMLLSPVLLTAEDQEIYDREEQFKRDRYRHRKLWREKGSGMVEGLKANRYAGAAAEPVEKGRYTHLECKPPLQDAFFRVRQCQGYQSRAGNLVDQSKVDFEALKSVISEIDVSNPSRKVLQRLYQACALTCDVKTKSHDEVGHILRSVLKKPMDQLPKWLHEQSACDNGKPLNIIKKL